MGVQRGRVTTAREGIISHRVAGGERQLHRDDNKGEPTVAIMVSDNFRIRGVF